MTTKALLKPCPFCGGEELDLQSYFDGQWHYVACMDCCARGGERQTRKEAIEFWQKRNPEAE